MSRRRVASHSEVLKFFTDVMRREDAKVSDALSAADRLHKYYLQEQPSKKDTKMSGVVLMPEVREEGEK